MHSRVRSHPYNLTKLGAMTTKEYTTWYYLRIAALRLDRTEKSDLEGQKVLTILDPAGDSGHTQCAPNRNGA